MKVLYNTLFKRTSTFAVGIMASAFFFERSFDLISEQIFESTNKGVSSQCLTLCKLLKNNKCNLSFAEIVEGH